MIMFQCDDEVLMLKRNVFRPASRSLIGYLKRAHYGNRLLRVCETGTCASCKRKNEKQEDREERRGADRI